MIQIAELKEAVEVMTKVKDNLEKVLDESTKEQNKQLFALQK